MKKTISILSLLFILSIQSFSQSSRYNVLRYWTPRVVPTLINDSLTWKSFWNIVDDGSPSTVWRTTGNTLGNNTSFIGTLDNTSLVMKTYTNNGYVKFDSAMVFTVKQSSTSVFSFQPWVGGATSPAIYLGASTPSVVNYFGLFDGTNSYINSSGTMILRSNNVTFLQGITNTSVTGQCVTMPAVGFATMAANSLMNGFKKVGNNVGWNAGTTALQVENLFTSPTYSANTTATITDASGMDVQPPIAGSGMTISRNWALRVMGNAAVQNSLIIGSSTTSPSAQLHNIGTFISTGTGSIGGTFTTGAIATTSYVNINNNGTFASTPVGSMYKTAGTGLSFVGVTGSGQDMAFFNPAGTGLFKNPTGTANMHLAEAGSVSIGANTTPSAALHVFGNQKTSGTFSLGAANLTGGNTGTVAVLSDIPSVSGYVPYTGATGSVNLGANQFSVSAPSTFSSGLFNGSLNTALTFTATGASVLTGGITTPTVYGSSASGGTLNLFSTSNATKGLIQIGSSGTVNIGVGGVNSTSLGLVRISQGTSTIDIGETAGAPALWFNTTSPNPSNYSFRGNSGSLVANASNNIAFYIGTNEGLTLYTNRYTFNLNTAATTGAITTYAFNPPSHTGQTTGTEINGFKYAGANRTWAGTTTIANQREVYFSAYTYNSSGGNTIITKASGLSVDAPVAGTSITITSPYAIESNGNINIIGRIDASGGIKGTTTNDNATAGNVGESVTSILAVGSATSFTTVTAMNILTISLTAGDWDVEANLNFNESVSTVSARSAGIGTVSATVPTDGSECYNGVQSTVTTEKNTITMPNKRISIASTTTVYLVGSVTFAAGTCSGFGTLTARRVR